MLRVALGACLLFAWYQGNLAAQANVMTLRERSRDYLGCYELRLFDWNTAEGRDAAASIPNRVMLNPTTLALRYEGPDSSVIALDLALTPFPGYGSSDFINERWSLSSATDSVVLTWSNASAGVQAVLALSGSVGAWRLNGRTAAWSDDAGTVTPGQSATATLRGRAAGRSVDCDR